MIYNLQLTVYYLISGRNNPNIMNLNDLENRLIDFLVKVIFLARILERTYAGRQLSNQITRAFCKNRKTKIQRW